jgi:hypothetical protein
MIDRIQLIQEFRQFLLGWSNKIKDEHSKNKIIESLTYAKSDRQLENIAKEIDEILEKQK